MYVERGPAAAAALGRRRTTTKRCLQGELIVDVALHAFASYCRFCLRGSVFARKIEKKSMSTM
jgi:hypothetical protein